MTWHSLPLSFKVAGRPVILVGKGEAADAKRRLLERAGAVVVGEEYLPHPHPSAPPALPPSPAGRGKGPAAEGSGKGEGDPVSTLCLAIVALDDDAEAQAAVTRLRIRGILVNAVDRPELCDFTLPAIVDRDPVLVAIGTGGVSAGLAAALRQRLEGLLPPELGSLAGALYAARGTLRREIPDSGKRRRAIATALAPGAPLDPLSEQQSDVVTAILASQTTERTEHIVLVSGDPDDLTLRHARWLANADVVLHRACVPSAILDRARADAVRIAVAGDWPQASGEGLTVSIEAAP